VYLYFTQFTGEGRAQTITCCVFKLAVRGDNGKRVGAADKERSQKALRGFVKSDGGQKALGSGGTGKKKLWQQRKVGGSDPKKQKSRVW